MKRNSIKIMLTAGILAVSAVSCKKNLILSPNDELTSQQVFSTPAGIDQAMAKVYGSFAVSGNSGPGGASDIQGVDGGTSDFFREFFNCEDLPTDKAVLSYTDPGVQDVHSMSWKATHAISHGLYYRSL